MSTTTYEVETYWDGAFYVVRVLGLPDGPHLTQAESADDVLPMAQDYISNVLDLDPAATVAVSLRRRNAMRVIADWLLVRPYWFRKVGR